jgi:DNA-dependent RNA polymerase auxiliary subunit epsilon
MVARKLELDTIAIAKESQCQAQNMKQNTRQKLKRKLHNLKYITQLDNNSKKGIEI